MCETQFCCELLFYTFLLIIFFHFVQRHDAVVSDAAFYRGKSSLEIRDTPAPHNTDEAEGGRV